MGIILKRKTKKPIIVVMVGLVGSGKSSVARELAPLIGGTVIEGDAVRIALRKRNQSYALARGIVEKTAFLALKRGSNVVIDSDFIDQKKRKSIQSKAKSAGAKVIYLRTIAGHDVMIGRLASAQYSAQSFFGGARSLWKGHNKGAVVALREMWRRTPHHYRWSEKNGGRFILKKLRIPFFAELDTTGNWKKTVHKIAKKLTTRY